MSDDAFAVLGVPRRPWLEPDAIDSAFHRITLETHPDRNLESGSNAAFQEANAAYQTLFSPSRRARALWESVTGGTFAVVEKTPESLFDLFWKIGVGLRELDAAIESVSGAPAAPLLRARKIREASEALSNLNPLRADVERRRDELLGALRDLDAEWEAELAAGEASRKRALEELERLARELTHCSRWLAQMDEKLFELRTSVSGLPFGAAPP